MYCPRCKDEFRPGFTRCEGCGVDLVEDLTTESEMPEKAGVAQTSPVVPAAMPMLDYCGFLGLDDARQARDTLRPRGIPSEITIREVPGSPTDGPVQEEYWLRVPAKAFRQVSGVLGYDAISSESEESEVLECGQCGKAVAPEETFCASCGARFD